MRAGFVRWLESAHHLSGAGACERPHGHSYRVEAAFALVQGGKDAAGMEEALDRVLAQFDRQDLNARMPFPSCEHLTLALAEALRREGAPSCRLQVFEGHAKWAEWEKGR